MCLLFVGIRWGWLGPHLTWQALDIPLDKWQIGWLRVLNLTTFSIVVYWLRRHLVKFIAVEPFLTLGKASLRVFCAHIFFVFVGLALLVRDVGDDVGAPLEQLHGIAAILLVAVTFTMLILVAFDQVRKRKNRRRLREGTNSGNPAPSAGPRRTDAQPDPGFAPEMPARVRAAEAHLPASLCAHEQLTAPLSAVENTH
jgi:hypothetical protein